MYDDDTQELNIAAHCSKAAPKGARNPPSMVRNKVIRGKVVDKLRRPMHAKVCRAITQVSERKGMNADEFMSQSAVAMEKITPC